MAFIDVLRGVALCGVLLANLPWWTGDVFMTPAERAAFPTAGLDDAVRFLLHALVGFKFIGLFSILFGLGCAVQLQRLRNSGQAPRRVLARRLAFLLVLGVVHGYLLWCGDILRYYALWGALLLLFERTAQRRVLFWGLILGVVVPGLWRGALNLFGGPEAVWSMEAAELDARTLRAFASGSYADVLRWNWAYDWSLTLSPGEGAWHFFVFGRFLLGLWVGRAFLLPEPHAHRASLRRMARWGLALGLPLNVLYAVLIVLEDRRVIGADDLWMAAAPLAVEVGFLALTAFYACGLALLYERPRWRSRLDLIAPAGRMALTNYLMHTVIGLWLFYGFAPGPHLMRRVGLCFIVPVWLAVFGLQVWLSRWWLARFRFGPLEWLWRSLTYARLQPMRQPANAATVECKTETSPTAE